MLLSKPNKLASARQQINIQAVKDDVLILSGSSYRSIIETSSVNFELKSEAEQDTIIDTYQSFLNSLGCPIQILIRTREIDLDNYLLDLTNKTNKEQTLLYKDQLISYTSFIKGLVNANRILSRSFFVVVPYDITLKHEFDFAKEQLSIRTELIIKGLQRLGMHTRVLSSLEILNLFYVYYNPSIAKTQPLSAAASRLMHTVLIKKTA